MPQQDLAAQLQALEEKQQKRLKRRRILALILALLAVIGAFAGQWYGSASHAEERLDQLNSRAHTLRLVLEQWEWRGNTIESGVGQIQNDDDPLHQYLLYYFGGQEGEWYGIYCDDTGEIAYTLCSAKPLTEEELSTPPDRETMLKKYKNPFPWVRAGAVGVWYTDDTRNIRPEAKRSENTAETTE